MSRRRVNDAKDIVTMSDRMVDAKEEWVRRCEQVDRSVLQVKRRRWATEPSCVVILLLCYFGATVNGLCSIAGVRL